MCEWVSRTNGVDCATPPLLRVEFVELDTISRAVSTVRHRCDIEIQRSATSTPLLIFDRGVLSSLFVAHFDKALSTTMPPREPVDIHLREVNPYEQLRRLLEFCAPPVAKQSPKETKATESSTTTGGASSLLPHLEQLKHALQHGFCDPTQSRGVAVASFADTEDETFVDASQDDDEEDWVLEHPSRRNRIQRVLETFASAVLLLSLVLWLVSKLESASMVACHAKGGASASLLSVSPKP